MKTNPLGAFEVNGDRTGSIRNDDEFAKASAKVRAMIDEMERNGTRSPMKVAQIKAMIDEMAKYASNPGYSHDTNSSGTAINTPDTANKPQEYNHASVGHTNRNDFDIVGTVVRGYTGYEREVYIPEGITETGTIKPGEGAFCGKRTIKKLVFPRTMRKIGARACADCANLEEVIIPEGVTTIGKYSFAGCTSLERIHLPSTIRSVEERAFAGCTSLKQIHLPSAICSIEKGAFAESGLVSIQFPPHLKNIGEKVFEKCAALEKAVIPGTVEEIGYTAFSGCSNLRVLDIQSGVRTIGIGAFEACTALTEVNLPEGLEKIGWDAFKDCFYLKSVSIPESVQKIDINVPYYGSPSGPFTNCTGLYDIKHPARFGATCFIGSPYYEPARKLEQERMALERERQRSQRIREERLKSGKCPKCNIKLSLLGRKCSKCGKRY